MSEFKQIGTVEIIATRVYPLDAEANGTLGADVLVEPDTYRVFSDGISHYWLMNGRLTAASIRRGDGLFMFVPGFDATVDIQVQFPSCIYGPDEWAEFLENDPVAVEGHPDQRLRFDIWDVER